MKNKSIKIISTTIFVILLLGVISAFGIGCAYHPKNPLTLTQGEKAEVKIKLQATDQDESVTLRPNIVSGSEIIKLTNKSDIFVPGRGTEYLILEVNIPENAEIGTVYPVRIEFNSITTGESGTLGIGMIIPSSFNVVVIPTPEEQEEIEAKEFRLKQIINYTILGLIIIISIIIIIVIKKKKKRKKK